MDWLALCGWLVALMAGVAWWRARRATAPALIAKPPSKPSPETDARATEPAPDSATEPAPDNPRVTVPSDDGPQRAYLYAADGTLESVRRLRGHAPRAFTRGHGHDAVTVYTRQGQDASRVIYQAEP